MTKHGDIENKDQDVRSDVSIDTDPPKRNRKKLNRMILQSRIRMLVNAIFALVVLLLVYTVYISAIHGYFDKENVRGKFIRSIITAVELHENGVRVEKPAYPTIEVTPFLTQKTTLKLYRDVGDWQVITGEVRAEMSISGKLTYSIVNTGTYLNRDGLASFILPSSIMSDKPITNTQRQEDDLKQLEKIEDGNVADLSFSINALMSPEKLMKMLGNYDVVVTGMPVYAGELKDFDIAHSVGGGIDYYVPYLTLRPMSQFSENNRLSMWQLYFRSEDKDKMSQHVDYMMSDLEWMNNNIKYSFLDIDKQRLAYLRTHGVQVYGAILTGPVRELQKLKQHPEFHYFRLSRIEVWNWDKKQ